MKTLGRCIMASSSAPVLRHSRRYVVTSFIRGLHSTYLLVQRSDAVGSYSFYWGGVSGGMEDIDEGDALRRAYVEIEEEVGYQKDEVAFVRHGRPLLVDDGPSKQFWIQPFLFDLHSAREPRLNWENVQARYYTRYEMKKLQTVPLLVETVDRVVVAENTWVAHACRVLEDDREHGAAELCFIALEELRNIVSQRILEDHSGVKEYMTNVRNAAWHLASRRENMAPVANGLALVLADAVSKILKKNILGKDIRSAKEIIIASIDAQESALKATRNALIEQSCMVIESLATRSDRTSEISIMTVSLSSTVTRVIQGLIQRGIAVNVTVCESRPLCEGVVAAKQFHAMGAEAVTLITDAQLASYIEKCDIALCGADSLTSKGFVNKVCTHSLALHARHTKTRMVVLSDLTKASPGPVFDVVSGKKMEKFESEEKDSQEVSDMWMTMGLLEKEDVSPIHPGSTREALHVCNSYFEETPYELADMIISHQGIVTSKDIQEHIQELEGVYLSAFVW